MKQLFLLLLITGLSNSLLGQSYFNIAGGYVVQSDNFLVLNNAGFNSNGAFNAQGGTVTLSGDAADNLSAIGGISGTTFYRLDINKTANNTQLNQSIEIADMLTFSGGHLDIQGHNLTIQNGGSIVGADAAKHVKTTGAGALIQTVGASPVEYPIGNDAYNPATLSNQGDADAYSVRVANDALSSGNAGSPLPENAVDRSWFIEEATPGGSDLSLTLQWNGAEELPGFDRSMAYVSHYLAGSWDAQPVISASGAGPYNLSRSGITSLSPFAVLGHNFTAFVDIFGRIIWSRDGSSGIPGATVTLGGDDSDTDLSIADGSYNLTASYGSTVTITPTKDLNKLNGLTAGDALTIQQHLTGANTITDPYELVAADLDWSDYISTFDALIILQTLLGNPAALPQFRQAWRFVPASYALPALPWGFPEQIDLSNLTANISDQNFLGIKMGDLVSSFADPANLSPLPPLVLRTDDAILQAGAEHTVLLRADQFDDLAAWQFALQFDPAQLELLAVETADSALPLAAGNFGLFNSAAGEIRMVWSQSGGIMLGDAAPVFQLKFKALQSGGKLSDALGLDESVLPAYAYDSQVQETGVELKFLQTTSVSQPGALQAMQLTNRPNPFTDETTVSFTLPEACAAQLRVVDVIGRELWRSDKFYAAGPQIEKIRLDAAAGVLFCELTTPFGTCRRNMLSAR